MWFILTYLVLFYSSKLTSQQSLVILWHSSFNPFTPKIWKQILLTNANRNLRWLFLRIWCYIRHYLCMLVTPRSERVNKTPFFKTSIQTRHLQSHNSRRKVIALVTFLRVYAYRNIDYCLGRFSNLEVNNMAIQQGHPTDSFGGIGSNFRLGKCHLELSSVINAFVLEEIKMTFSAENRSARIFGKAIRPKVFGK